MSTTINSEGSLAFMDHLVRDLRDQQFSSVRTTIQEITRESSLAHHINTYTVYDRYDGRVLYCGLAASHYEMLTEHIWGD
jgi:hypothetical protein